MSQELVRYDAMCHAIAEAWTFDDILPIADKAAAWAAAMKVAKNHEAEDYARKIRVRAERRIGELSSQLPKLNPSECSKLGAEKRYGKSYYFPEDAMKHPVHPLTSKAQILRSHGLNKHTAGLFEQLARIPKDEFEGIISNTPRPVAQRIVHGQYAQSATSLAAGKTLTLLKHHWEKSNGSTRGCFIRWIAKEGFDIQAALDAKDDA